MPPNKSGNSSDNAKGRKPGMGRVLAYVLVALIIFGLGDAVGRGQLHLAFGGGTQPVTGLPAQLDYSSVNEVYQALKNNYDGKLNESQVLDGLKEGLAAS